MSELNFFITGASTSLFFVAALFFLRYAKKTSDKFFQLFALAFAVLGVDRIVGSIIGPTSEFRPSVYLLRLLAFLIIIFAVLVKNRASNPRQD